MSARIIRTSTRQFTRVVYININANRPRFCEFRPRVPPLCVESQTIAPCRRENVTITTRIERLKSIRWPVGFYVPRVRLVTLATIGRHWTRGVRFLNISSRMYGESFCTLSRPLGDVTLKSVTGFFRKKKKNVLLSELVFEKQKTSFPSKRESHVVTYRSLFGPATFCDYIFGRQKHARARRVTVLGTCARDFPSAFTKMKHESVFVYWVSPFRT